MRLGICLSSVKTPLGSKIDWDNTGHGCYLFGAYGWVYSHSDATVNCKTQSSFGFRSGDTVEMSYDPTRRKLRASKGKEQYELSVPAGDYRVCAVMCWQGDRVAVE